MGVRFFFVDDVRMLIESLFSHMGSIDDFDQDVVIVGAGAAGLMTAIWVARSSVDLPMPPRILLVDGAKKIGAKILVAGGGRCNVTHERVLPKDYAGSKNTIKKALKAFSETDTVEFFSQLGVELKREDTGKLFPVTDTAKTVLNALLSECSKLGVQLEHPWRVSQVEQNEDGFVVHSNDPDTMPVRTPRVVIATGGMALPKTGSDGAGYRFVKALGHRVTPRVLPSLVPIVLNDESSWVMELSGIATRVSIEVRSGSGKRLKSFTNQILCTHFGLSGPAALDVSRWYFDAKLDDPQAKLIINWMGEGTFDELDQTLQSIGKKSVAKFLSDFIPERLAKAICSRVGVDPLSPGHTIRKEQRRKLVHALLETEVIVERDRGFTFAEVTAGGVPLDEIQISTMKSRVCDGLWIVGEILDVDGRIGGFNFQWAWANGFIAGKSIADSYREDSLSMT
jgi:predicted Rossmann fold flavoprotein